MDALDCHWYDDRNVAFGFLSDFGVLNDTARLAFLTKNTGLVREVFEKTIGRPLAFYPECPAGWLTSQDFLDQGGSLDPEFELNKLRSLVEQLLNGKDEFAARVRAVPMGRQLKHGKLRFAEGLEVTKLIPKYPKDCTADERNHVEAVARTSMNAILDSRPGYLSGEWPRHFWRYNYDLATCKPRKMAITSSRVATEAEGRAIAEILEANSKKVRNYITTLINRLRVDLYDPTRDEVLFGLFSRVTRLCELMTSEPSLWARDLAGIVLRCLADTGITFCYLASKGTKEDFERFIKYGEGQAKLLMLHLQDNYPEQSSLEGMSVEDLSDELGTFALELLDIDLGHWNKKDARKLAQEVGLERVYRLVFSPTSADIHGTWMSLKNSNLTHCVEPLHRFHRLPSLAEPPLFVGTVEAARELYERCVKIGVDSLGYPKPDEDLEPIAVSSGDDQNSR